MAVEIKPKREKRPIGVSFRFSETAMRNLRIICEATGHSQIDVIEEALKDAVPFYERKYPKEMKAARAKIGKK